jgi:predicted lipid-binding transport protein (Tim44 family)
MADEQARPESAPQPDRGGVRALLATRRGRALSFGVFGVLLLAVAGALVWGLTGNAPERVAAATAPATSSSAAPTTAAAAASTSTAPATSAAPTTAAAATTATPPPSSSEAAPAATSAAAATTVKPGPWCTSDCTATSAQRAMELAIMAVQANDVDAFRQVTIDMDINDVRSALSHGAPDVRPCQEDDGDANCIVVFGTAVFDYSAQQLPYDPSEGPTEMPWAITYVQAH